MTTASTLTRDLFDITLPIPWKYGDDQGDSIRVTLRGTPANVFRTKLEKVMIEEHRCKYNTTIISILAKAFDSSFSFTERKEKSYAAISKGLTQMAGNEKFENLSQAIIHTCNHHFHATK